MYDSRLTPETIRRDPEAAGEKLLKDSRAIVMLMNAETDQSKQAVILRESHFIEDCELLEQELSKLPDVPADLQTVLAETKPLIACLKELLKKWSLDEPLSS